MIQSLNACIQGKLGEWSIDDVKCHIADMIDNNYEKTLEIDPNENVVNSSNYAKWLMFGNEHFIHINSKNIEFTETFHYENYRPQTNAVAKMFRKGIVKDFLIHVVVYRLGQYSYFAADVTPLIENVLDCGAC